MKTLEACIYLLGGILCMAPALGSGEWIGEPSFCHHRDCPEYKSIEEGNPTSDFEKRAYVASRWITTKVLSSGTGHLWEAYNRLKSYCEGGNDQGTVVSQDNWPGLMTVSEGEDGTEEELYMSWFVAPDADAPTPTDNAVRVIDKPAETFYVRVFGGIVTHSAGQENAKLLRADLARAGRHFDPLTYTGAVYEGRYVLIGRHNEIWIKAMD